MVCPGGGGLSRQAFYYHFSDLYGVVDYGIQQLLDKLGAVRPEDWHTAIERTLTFWASRSRV